MNDTDTNLISALMLDDERKSIETAKEKFLKVNIVIESTLRIEDFEKKDKDYTLIFSDFDLRNISKVDNGIKMLVKTRAKNKYAFLVLYSAFLSSLTQEQIELLEKHDIHTYDKKDQVAAQNIRIDYDNYINSKNSNPACTNDNKVELMKKHYDATKNLALSHLEGISHSPTLVPLLKRKKLFTPSDLISEIEADSDIGSEFVLQYLETLALVDKKKPKT
jgi:predicted nucleotidyltransferase